MRILGSLGRRRVPAVIGVPIVVGCGLAGYSLAPMDLASAPRSQAFLAEEGSATSGAASQERQRAPVGSDSGQPREDGLQTGSIDRGAPAAPAARLEPHPQSREKERKESAKSAPGLVQGAARALEPIPVLGPLFSLLR